MKWLLLTETLKWVLIGFCIAVGFGIARVAWWILARLTKPLREEIELEREVKAYSAQHRGKEEK